MTKKYAYTISVLNHNWNNEEKTERNCYYRGQYSVVTLFIICLQFQVVEPRRGQKTKHS